MLRASEDVLSPSCTLQFIVSIELGLSEEMSLFDYLFPCYHDIQGGRRVIPYLPNVSVFKNRESLFVHPV